MSFTDISDPLWVAACTAGGAAPVVAPVIDLVDPLSFGDRDGPITFTLTGSNLDHGTISIVDRDTHTPVITNITTNSDSEATVDMDAAGITSFGTHTFDFTNDVGTTHFNIDIIDD